MCKKTCKECPWINSNPHSLKFRNYFNKMKTIGVETHGCHMITKDIWGKNEKISDKNFCKGQQNINK